jgi:hypothetical protein
MRTESFIRERKEKLELEGEEAIKQKRTGFNALERAKHEERNEIVHSQREEKLDQ